MEAASTPAPCVPPSRPDGGQAGAGSGPPPQRAAGGGAERGSGGREERRPTSTEASTPSLFWPSMSLCFCAGFPRGGGADEGSRSAGASAPPEGSREEEEEEEAEASQGVLSSVSSCSRGSHSEIWTSFLWLFLLFGVWVLPFESWVIGFFGRWLLRCFRILRSAWAVSGYTSVSL